MLIFYIDTKGAFLKSLSVYISSQTNCGKNNTGRTWQKNKYNMNVSNYLYSITVLVLIKFTKQSLRLHCGCVAVLVN